MPCVQCRRCQSDEVVPSRWRFSATDLWTAATLRRPLRCTACLHRFGGWVAASNKPARRRPKGRKHPAWMQSATTWLAITCALWSASPSRADVVITNLNPTTPSNGTALSTTGNSNSNRITFTPGAAGLFRMILDLNIWNNNNGTGKNITSATLNFSSVGSIGSSSVLGSVTSSNAVTIAKRSYGNLLFDLGDINLTSGGAEIVFTLTGVTGGAGTNDAFWSANGTTYTDPSSLLPGWVNVTPTTAIGAISNGYQWELQAAHAPEPGTLLLGLIASSAGSGAVWWKRRKRPAPPPEEEPAVSV